MRDFKEKKYDSKVVTIRRVTKVTAGNKRLRFSAMVVVGDRNGSVGVGLGRGVDTKSAVEKGTRRAEKVMKKIQLIGDTIPHEITHKRGASKVVLKPARPGTGIIAGTSVRAVLELCGIESVYGKVLGSNDLISNAYTTFEALKLLRNERVLRKMKKMQERVGMKEEMDKERAEKEKLRRKKERKEGRGDRDRRDSRGGRDRRDNRSRGAGRPDRRAAPAKK